MPPRLTPDDVKRLERLLGGDGRVEDQVLRYLAARYGAKNLFFVPRNVAQEIFRRPADFLRAVARHTQPELFR